MRLSVDIIIKARSNTYGARFATLMGELRNVMEAAAPQFK
jgi:hypothetical protein